MSVRLAVFDCDGTLVDSQADICGAMETAFSRNGHAAPPKADIRRVVGLSLPVAMRMLAPDLSGEQTSGIVEAYKAAFRETRMAGALHEPLFDGMAGLLTQLTARDWALGVATGKSEKGLLACLAHHGIGNAFATLQTADHHPSKPHPAMLERAIAEAGANAANTVMIGDTSYDIEMARAIGVRAIGVSWGYHPAQELLDCGAAAVAETPAQLAELLP